MNAPQPLPAWMTERYPPAREPLFDWFRKQITDAMLAEISRADYGLEDAAHLAASKSIRAGELVTTIDYWHPREVLELTRWSEPDQGREKRTGISFTGHRKRGFCCIALLQADDVEFSSATLIQLIESCLLLDEPYGSTLAGFLAWKFPRLDRRDHRFWIVLALVGLALEDAPPPAARQDELAALILDHHDEAFGDYPCLPDIRHETWQAWIDSILGRADKTLSNALRGLAILAAPPPLSDPSPN